MNSNELKHYGILWMKWGRRKGANLPFRSGVNIMIIWRPRQRSYKSMSTKKLTNKLMSDYVEKTYKELDF